MVVYALLPLAVVVCLLATLRALHRFVPERCVDVVHRRGEYSRTLGTGVHFFVPGLDRVRARFHSAPQFRRYASVAVRSEDGVGLNVTVFVHYRVLDYRRATDAGEDTDDAVERWVKNAVSEVVGQNGAHRVLVGGAAIAANALGETNRRALRQGIHASHLYFGVEGLSDDEEGHLSTRVAEAAGRGARERRADRVRTDSVDRAEHERQATVLRAEYERQATVIRAEGEAEAVRIIARARSEAWKRALDVLIEQSPTRPPGTPPGQREDP